MIGARGGSPANAIRSPSQSRNSTLLLTESHEKIPSPWIVIPFGRSKTKRLVRLSVEDHLKLQGSVHDSVSGSPGAGATWSGGEKIFKPRRFAAGRVSTLASAPVSKTIRTGFPLMVALNQILSSV